MPRYKPIDTGLKFLPIDLSLQGLPGDFEHALNHRIDQELDLRSMDERFKNDESGAPCSQTRRVRGENRATNATAK